MIETPTTIFEAEPDPAVVSETELNHQLRQYLENKWPDLESGRDRAVVVGQQVAEYLLALLPESDELTVKLRQVLLEKLLDQQITNPEQFVSHGADHSLTVAKLTAQAYEVLPLVKASLEAEFGTAARVIVTLTALMHDMGYPRLLPEDKKITHARYGRDIFLQEMALLFAEKFDLNSAQITKIADTIDDHDNDGIENREVIVMGSDQENQLLFLVRLADRLDMTADRLSEIQRHPVFREVTRQLFLAGQPDGPLFECQPDHYTVLLEESRGKLLAMYQPTVPADVWANLHKNLQLCNDVSYPHFLGCLAVKEVAFSLDDDGGLLVTVSRHLGYEADDELKVAGTIPVTEYQVWRAERALTTLQYNGVPPKVVISSNKSGV